MPIFDRKCSECGTIDRDLLEPSVTPAYPCGRDRSDPILGWDVRCLGVMDRVWLPVDQGGRSNGVVDDSIPGGLYIKHGLCNPDGSPRRFDSHTDIRKAEQRAGLVNRVEHVGAQGSDKSKHTVKWT